MPKECLSFSDLVFVNTSKIFEEALSIAQGNGIKGIGFIFT